MGFYVEKGLMRMSDVFIFFNLKPGYVFHIGNCQFTKFNLEQTSSLQGTKY